MTSKEPSSLSWIDNAMSTVDHIAARVTAAAFTGLGGGAAFATFKGFPVPKTAMSACVSCALVSTACFGMERAANGIILRATRLGEGSALTAPALGADNTGDSGDSSEVNIGGASSLVSLSEESTPSRIIYASHALGGLFGGGIVGFLFQRTPFGGGILFTSVMLGVAQIEVTMNQYREDRLREIMEAKVYRKEQS